MRAFIGQRKSLRRALLTDKREIETTAVSVIVTCTVVMVVEHVVGVVVGDDKSSGVELMRSEWREHPLERCGPLCQALLAYVRDIETTVSLVTVTLTVVVVVVVDHVAGVVVGVDEAGGVELIKL